MSRVVVTFHSENPALAIEAAQRMVKPLKAENIDGPVLTTSLDNLGDYLARQSAVPKVNASVDFVPASAQTVAGTVTAEAVDDDDTADQPVAKPKLSDKIKSAMGKRKSK